MYSISLGPRPFPEGLGPRLVLYISCLLLSSSFSSLSYMYIERLFTLICIHVICTLLHAACHFCSIPTIIIRGDMHYANVFLFQCPLPSSCNDSYFITAFPTLCSSLPVQPQSVSIHTICCMCMHSCQIFALPSSCNDSYFIAASPTLCSSLPVQAQGVSIICCMCMPSCQMFGLYMYVHYTLPMYIHTCTSKTPCVLGSFLASSPGSTHK